MCDGDTIGCPTCNVHNCTIPLENQQKRFCPTHAHLSLVCAVTGCDNHIADGKRTCEDPDHQALESAYFDKGKALFQLKERLRKARASNIGDSILEANDLVDNAGDDAVEIEMDFHGCDGKADDGNHKLRAQFGRRRTHNEQLIMRPCGVILSRATFYGAEAISSVHVSHFNVMIDLLIYVNSRTF